MFWEINEWCRFVDNINTHLLNIIDIFNIYLLIYLIYIYYWITHNKRRINISDLLSPITHRIWWKASSFPSIFLTRQRTAILQQMNEKRNRFKDIFNNGVKVKPRYKKGSPRLGVLGITLEETLFIDCVRHNGRWRERTRMCTRAHPCLPSIYISRCRWWNLVLPDQASVAGIAP